MSSDEETVPETEAKRLKVSGEGRAKGGSGAGVSGGGIKAEIASLLAQKKKAAKSEDYAEAMRLKGEIDKLTATQPAAGKRERSPKAAAAANSPKKAKTEAPSKAPPRPRVAELTSEPFFDDATAARVQPQCVTACEREAYRAVQTGNTAFLCEKLAGKVPLCLQRDVASRQTAMHAAILKADSTALNAMIKTLAKLPNCWETNPHLRTSSLKQQDTGEMSVATLGFATGKVGAARGGREMNNALADPDEPMMPMEMVVARSPMTEDQVKLLAQYGMLTAMPKMRRGKVMKRSNRRNTSPFPSIETCVEPAVMMGNLQVLKALLTLIDSSFGVTETHRAAVGDGDLSDKLQSRSIIATMRVGGQLSPIHFAAINPDASKLETMLKREPSALNHASPGHLLPIHLAAACEGPEPLKLLLSEWQAKRNTPGPNKRTPLHFAAAAGRACNIRLLMGAGGGPAAATQFPKEIRALLERQSGSALKIGNDGILMLSQLLTDLLRRIADEAHQRGAGGGAASKAAPLRSAALEAAAGAVLKGAKLAQHIADTAKQVADGRLQPAECPSSARAVLHRKLSGLSEDALHQIFEKSDKNGDGQLDTAEVKNIFSECGITMGKNTFPKIFKAMDTDSSGAVSFDEFAAWMEAGSTFAKSLRRAFMASTGDMQPGEVAEAEAAEEGMKDMSSLVFSIRPLLEILGLVSGEDADSKRCVDYASALMECVCSKVLEISANAARSQKKTSVTAEHVLTSINANEDLAGLYQQDTVVMNSMLLPMKDKEGYTALHCAAEAGHTECVEALVACSADINFAGPDRKTPLALAAEQGHVQCVKALLAAGAKLETGDKRKRTPLLLAVRAGRAVVASVLLHNGANPNAADDSGNTVTHYAAAFGWAECVDLLHQAGANLSVPNQMKLAPVTAALQKGHRTVFRRMLELGIDVNFRDADGKTLLLNCLDSMSRAVLGEVQFMLSKRADPTLTSTQGLTVLHKVAGAGFGGSAYHNAFAPHPFEDERLARLRGWVARPKPPEQANADFESDSEADFANADVGLPQETVSEKVHERGFHQLTMTEREALFRLGWDQASWQRGDNPTMSWSELDDQKRDAARTLGLDEQTWTVLPVRTITDVRGADGNLPVRHGWALGHNVDVHGEVRVLYKTAGGGIENMHISRVLLADEIMEGKLEHISVAVARVLLEQKAAPDGRNARGTTPLMLALRMHKTDLAMLLLEHGANPNTKEDVSAPAPGQPPPEPMTPLLYLASGPAPQPHPLYWGTFPVYVTVMALIAKGLEVSGAMNHKIRSPVVELVNGLKDYLSAKVLIEAGADPSADKSGRNVLHYTLQAVFTESGAPDFAKFLLSHAVGAKLLVEFSTQTPHVTPLHDLTAKFVKLGRAPTCVPTDQMKTWAETKAQMLLDLITAMPSSTDISTYFLPAEKKEPPPPSPLSHICSASELCQHAPELCKASVELLCKRGVDPNGSDNCPAALHSLLAEVNDLSSSQLVRVLLPLTDLTAPMQGGHALLAWCLKRSWTSIRGGSPVTSACIASARVLLEAKCDPNQHGIDLVRPLHIAASYRNEELIDALVAAKADAKVADKQGRTPLHYAVIFAPTGSDASFDAEELLLAAGADVAAKDVSQRCALHYAFLKGELALSFTPLTLQDPSSGDGWLHKSVKDGPNLWLPKAENLLGQRVDPIETVASLCAVTGVDVNAKDVEGMMPLHLAALRGSSISALKLVSAGAGLEEEFASNTPLGLAMHRYPETAVLLMQRNAKTTAICLKFDAMPGDGTSRVNPASLGFGAGPRFGIPRRAFLPHVSAEVNKKQESTTIFALAIQRLSALSSSDPTSASAYLGAAVSALDCGFPRSEALNDTISSAQYIMLLTLVPKVGDEVLQKQRFGGGQNVLHRLAAAKPPLEAQARMAMLKAARKLLDRGVLLDADDNGATPLHLACGNTFVDLVALILNHAGSRADTIVNAEDQGGVTALGRAFDGEPNQSEAIQIARLLIARGASVSRTIVNSKKKLSLLMQCIALKWPITGTRGQDVWPIVLFSSQAPDLTMADVDSQTCLMYAAMVGCPELLLHFAAWAATGKAADLFSIKDGKGQNALMHAIMAGKISFANELLHMASKVSPKALQEQLTTQAQDGSTAVTLAVQSDAALAAVCTLLRWMDDVVVEKVMGLVDSSGQTALAQAVLLNQLPVVQALLAGRPLKPLCTKTQCPKGKMAGDTVKARVTHRYSADAPSFSIKWMLDNEEHETWRLGENALHSVVVLTMPPGSGPGVEFEISWDAAIGGPASPGLATSFATEGSPRIPKPVLNIQDTEGRSVLHCCVAPLPFGSYENADMLACLLKAGVHADLKDAQGRTAADLASGQRSGHMVRCFQDLGIAPSSAPSLPSRTIARPAVTPVNADADAAAELASAEARKVLKEGGLALAPVDKGFKAPSANSRVVVVDGSDGKPLDLTMTKVDVAQGAYGKNVFYRMQVLHEQNQDNYLLFTRWGRTGERGQFQTTPFESLGKATAEFLKIFKSKSANDWPDRASFMKKPLKYQYHEITYSSGVQPVDALRTDKWVRIPAKVTPVPLQRLLAVCSNPELLARALESAKVDRPLGLLKRQPLGEAIELLNRIKSIVQQSVEEGRKSSPSGNRLQELADEIAAASSRVFELVPTRNFKYENVAPIDTLQKVHEWINQLNQADDIACAAKLLLGAQSKLESVSPVDYLFRALGANITPLVHDSTELQLLEQYICRSSPQECLIFNGKGAKPLPKKDPQAVPQAPMWQAICDTQCFSNRACTEQIPLTTEAGFTYRELASDSGAICIKKNYEFKLPNFPQPVKLEEIWVRPEGINGFQMLVRLSEREAASKVAAIYSIEPSEEQSGAGSTLLFHGSGPQNCLSILSQGLRIQPPGVQLQGAAFGNGIYFANSFAKSRGYCSVHQGVGFMLLCEVTLGKELEGSYDFTSMVKAARIAAAKKKLGLPQETKPGEHPALNNLCMEIDQQEVDDVTGTGYDSFHMFSGATPDLAGSVVHPGGCVVPCGKIVTKDGKVATGCEARDELIVYETNRVRPRYLIELRDPSEPQFLKIVVEPKRDEDVDLPPADAQGGGDDGGEGVDEDGDMDEEKDETSEEDE